MNERIQEIALQATETFTAYFDGRGNVTETYFDKEKFAELIMKECIDVVSKKCASPTAYNALAEHFGVEE